MLQHSMHECMCFGGSLCDSLLLPLRVASMKVSVRTSGAIPGCVTHSTHGVLSKKHNTIYDSL